MLSILTITEKLNQDNFGFITNSCNYLQLVSVTERKDDLGGFIIVSSKTLTEEKSRAPSRSDVLRVNG